MGARVIPKDEGCGRRLPLTARQIIRVGLTVRPQQKSSPGEWWNTPGAMDEAVEGSDMTHFSAWAFAWAICLVLASLAAWMITVAPERPVVREPIRVQLSCTQPGSEQPAKPGDWGILAAIPPHVTERSQPLAGDDHALVRGHVRQHLATVPEAPRPVSDPVRVMTLWEAHEKRQQAARRAALEAISAGRPDPGYTFPGAHRAPRVVA